MARLTLTRSILLVHFLSCSTLSNSACADRSNEGADSRAEADSSATAIVSEFKQRYDVAMLRLDSCGHLMRAGGHLIVCTPGDEEEALQKFITQNVKILGLNESENTFVPWGREHGGPIRLQRMFGSFRVQNCWVQAGFDKSGVMRTVTVPACIREISVDTVPLISEEQARGIAIEEMKRREPFAHECVSAELQALSFGPCDATRSREDLFVWSVMMKPMRRVNIDAHTGAVVDVRLGPTIN